ncbi:MAG: metal-dependent hydrolase [Novipirellula sp. JB048]
MLKLTWLSHASWLLETDAHRILLDPFLSDNPTAQSAPDAIENISHILVSHGHFDHVADVATIANRDDSTVVANFEIADWFAQKQQVKSTLGMNLGGQTSLPFGTVKMVPAQHSSLLPDGSYGGNPASFVLQIDGKRIYFACDTALFSDMRLYAPQVDVAVLPIGDLFTMGIDDSIEAIKLIEPKWVLPTHYNTWPPIEQDAAQWAERVRSETAAKPVVLGVGESFSV